MLYLLLFCAAASYGALPGEAVFLEGDMAMRAGRWTDAQTAFQACVTQDPALAPYARIRMAEALAQSGDKAGAAEGLRAFIAKSDQGPWRRRAQAVLSQIVDPVSLEAADLLQNVLQTDPRPWWMDPWTWKAAEAWVQDPARAQNGYAQFRRMVDTSPYVATRRDAARKLIASPAADDRLAAACGLLRSGTYPEVEKAILAHSPLLADASGKSLSPKEALAWLMNPMKPEELDAFVQANQAHAWLPICLGYAMRVSANGGKFDSAGMLCDRLVRLDAAGNAAGEALWWLARNMTDANREEAAIDIYRRLCRDCPKHYRADDAMYEIGRWLMRAQKNKEARDTLAALGKTYPDSAFRAQAYYFCGKLSLAVKADKAARLYFVQAMDGGVGDFYAHRALDQLFAMQSIKSLPESSMKVDGEDPVLRPYPFLLRQPALPEPLPEKVAADVRIQRLQFFGFHGLDEGEWEALEVCAEAAKTSNPEPWYRAAALSGFAHTVWNFLQAHPWGYKSAKPTPERLRLEFPLAYWPLIQEQAKETGLDPFLLLAIMRQESTFRSGVKSAAGAAGLMQVMPATAQWMAKKIPGFTKDQAAYLTIPANSVRLGAHYFQQMMDKADANAAYALASYNAGPGNCKKWRNLFGGSALDDFVEAIPFAETRQYIKKVLGNYAAYHSLYGPVKK